MLTITTNIQSLISQRSLNKATSRLNQAIERMTTGYKLNHASDNAANYSISTNLTTRLGAYQVAEENAVMGLDMLTTANDSLNQIYDKLTRLRALQEQAENGTYGETSLKAINTECNALVDEINRLYSTCEYNGIKLFENNPSASSKSDSFKPIDVVKRDTSAMIALSSVSSTSNLNANVYSLSTADDLLKLAELTNAGLLEAGSEFVLANDIDMSGIDWTPIGNMDPNTGDMVAFTGVFDGNGYKVSNLTYSAIPDSPDSYMALGGMFNLTTSATIKNLTLENINISSEFSSGNALIAPIACALDTLVDNCHITGTITAKSMFACAAGICAQAEGGAVVDSSSEVNILVEASAGTVAGLYVISPDEINHSSFSGNIQVKYDDSYPDSTITVGGLVGSIEASSIIANSNVSGKITLTGLPDLSTSGILIGDTSAAGYVYDCSYSSDVNSKLDWTNHTRAPLVSNITVDGRTHIAALDVSGAISKLEASYNGNFLKKVQRRDTSKMCAFEKIKNNTIIGEGLFSINSAADLAKLAEMANNGLIKGGEFVLSKDIDLSSYSNWTPIGIFNSDHTIGFNAVFDGNGYVVSNVNIKDNSASYSQSQCGLFAYIGNEGAIKNLGLKNVNIDVQGKINTPTGALAGQINGSVYNCYVEGGNIKADNKVGGLVGETNADITACYANINVSGKSSVGGLAGTVSGGGATISECFSSGEVSATSRDGGGLCGSASSAIITKSYSTSIVNAGTFMFGGLVGTARNLTLSDSYCSGTINSNASNISDPSHKTAGLVGYFENLNTNEYLNISNCSVLGESENLRAIFVGDIQNETKSNINITNCKYNSYYDTKSLSYVYGNMANLTTSGITNSNAVPYTYSTVKASAPVSAPEEFKLPEPKYSSKAVNAALLSLDSPDNAAKTMEEIYFQIGINSDESSGIKINTGFELDNIDNLRNIGIQNGYLNLIDSMIATVSAKQTEYGACENRLESALDEISTQYENLLSSRSTLKDADIAKVSSQYIQQQILQQASATLMSTANQTPALALQLL